MASLDRMPTRVAAAAAVGALIAAAWFAPTARADSGPSLGGRIAFDHIVFEGAEDIFTIAPDGSDPRQVTHTPPGQGGSEAPEWTPDGRLLFDSDRAGDIHVFVTHRDGGNTAQVIRSDGSDLSPGISPDGKLLAFEHDNTDLTPGGIFLSPRRHGDFDRFSQLTFTPFLATGGFDTDPEFSPDGSKIAFLRVERTDRPNARSAVWVINVDGTDAKPLTKPGLNAIYPRWSPDGTHIAFSSNGDNFTEDVPANVYVMRADGRDLTPVTHRSGGSHAFKPDWSPDGQGLVYATAARDQPSTNLEVMDLATGRTNVIWRGTAGTQDQDAVWSRR
jgi:TolB protein